MPSAAAIALQRMLRDKQLRQQREKELAGIGSRFQQDVQKSIGQFGQAGAAMEQGRVQQNLQKVLADQKQVVEDRKTALAEQRASLEATKGKLQAAITPPAPVGLPGAPAPPTLPEFEVRREQGVAREKAGLQTEITELEKSIAAEEKALAKPAVKDEAYWQNLERQLGASTQAKTGLGMDVNRLFTNLNPMARQAKAKQLVSELRAKEMQERGFGLKERGLDIQEGKIAAAAKEAAAKRAASMAVIKKSGKSEAQEQAEARLNTILFTPENESEIMKTAAFKAELKAISGSADNPKDVERIKRRLVSKIANSPSFVVNVDTPPRKLLELSSKGRLDQANRKDTQSYRDGATVHKTYAKNIPIVKAYYRNNPKQAQEFIGWRRKIANFGSQKGLSAAQQTELINKIARGGGANVINTFLKLAGSDAKANEVLALGKPPSLSKPGARKFYNALWEIESLSPAIFKSYSGAAISDEEREFLKTIVPNPEMSIDNLMVSLDQKAELIDASWEELYNKMLTYDGMENSARQLRDVVEDVDYGEWFGEVEPSVSQPKQPKKSAIKKPAKVKKAKAKVKEPVATEGFGSNYEVQWED